LTARQAISIPDALAQGHCCERAEQETAAAVDEPLGDREDPQAEPFRFMALGVGAEICATRRKREAKALTGPRP
jgi:hypothetical protein